MGGRGAGYGGIAAGAGAGSGIPKKGSKTSGHDLIANYNSGFDDNGNAQVTKWQGQVDDKAARFLSKANDDYTFRNGQFYDKNGNVITDQYGFYDGEYQKFSFAMGLNAKPQVMDDAAFDAMVQQNNLQLLYRGESGQNAADRFMKADLGHTGVGSFGDGYYFSTDKSNAIGYAQMKSNYNGTGKVETMVLSPTARAIKYTDLEAKFSSLSPKLRSALSAAGRSASAGYNNSGEAQLALKLGYNVVAVDYAGGRTYCYALDRSAFIVKKSLQTY